MVEAMCEEEEDMRPSFYKIIHQSLNTTQYLHLPEDFMKHTSKDESEKGILEVPTGGNWFVKVSKTARDIFLQDGWQDFVRDQSLGNHEFLIFKYSGNMHFNVQIFDKTGCEIQYGVRELENVYGGEKGDAPPEEVCKTVGKRRGRPPKTHVIIPTFKGRGRGRPPKLASSIHRCLTKIWATENGNEPESVSIGGASSTEGAMQERRLLTEDATGKAWNSALSFTSNYPYFLSYLTASNLKHPYFLKIPTAFANTHFPKCKTKVVLKDPRGEAWLVNFLPGINTFGRGWSAFLYDNQLGEGDVCVFELVGQLKLRVHVFSYL